MKKLFLLLGLAVVLAGSASLQASTLYMNPGFGGNLTGTADWSNTLGGPYNTTWVDGNDMYFDPTGGATTNYTINSNITTGTITLGSTSGSTANTTVKLNASGTNTISFNNITFGNTAATDTLYYYGPTLPGGSFSVNGRGTFYLAGTPSSSISGTVTLNSGAGAGQGTQILINKTGYLGNTTNIVMTGTSGANATFTLNDGSAYTIGSLSANAYAQIQTGSGAGATSTLTIDQSTNTTYAPGTSTAFNFTASHTGVIKKQGSGNLTFSGSGAFTNQYTDFAVAGGMLIVANTNSNGAAGDYNAIAVNAGGTLASDATGRTLVGNSQTLTSGSITGGANTNGFKATTAGTTAIIDPTGTFAITELDATSGLTLKIDSATDKLSLFTLTGAAAAGGFKIDLTGFTGIANNTTYTVLSWLSSTGVDLTHFAGVLGSGKVMNSSFGTGGFTTVTNAGVTSLELQVVPEPATWALLAGGSAFLGLVRRRRGMNKR